MERNINVMASNQRSKALLQVMKEMDEVYDMRSWAMNGEDIQFWDSQIKGLQ